MIRLRQHVPAFVDGATPKSAEAETIEALLTIPWVAKWAEDMGGEWENTVISWPYGRDAEPVTRIEKHREPIRKFYRWSISDGRLLVEHDEGRHWWVVGHLTSDTPVDLPRWEGGRYRARMADGTERVLEPGEVGSSCGDELRLRDGSTATWIRK